MGKVYTPPTIIEEEDYVQHMVFLAGSIEMDKAENWQERLIDILSPIDGLTVLNPRRKNWDSSWKQSIDSPNFVEQVDWELDGIESSDTIIFYFDPKTLSPITLLEYGMVSQLMKDKNMILCCPEGFYRKGNVDIVAKRIRKSILDKVAFAEGERTVENENAYVLKRFVVTHSLNELLTVAYGFFNQTIHGKK